MAWKICTEQNNNDQSFYNETYREKQNHQEIIKKKQYELIMQKTEIDRTHENNKCRLIGLVWLRFMAYQPLYVM